MKLSLLVNETKTVNLAGAQFYFESGNGKIEVKVVGGDSRRFELYAGQGFILKDGRRFANLEIVNLSGAVQDIEFEVSDSEKFDNRAKIDTSGVMNVKVVQGAKPTSRNFPTVITLVANTPKKILDIDLTRAKANMYFSAQTYLGSSGTVDATGYPISAGSDMTDENTAELWAFSVTGGTVNLMIEAY